MLSIEEAVKTLIGASTQISDTGLVPTGSAAGFVSAKDVTSDIMQPPFDRSPLDGYALRAEDTKGASRETPVTLKVIDKIMAGEASDAAVTEGTCVRLMTGAPIPKGATCVIRQENTDLGQEIVNIYEELNDHDNIGDAGEDFSIGTVLVPQGKRIDSFDCAIMASAGIDTVEVYRRPRIAVFTSGDELVMPGGELGPGKIYNSNLYLVGGRLREWNMDIIDISPVGDDPENMANAIKRVMRVADCVITTGGVSVGEKDIMHAVEKILDAEHLFWRIEIKPGAPNLAFKYAGKPVIALSGNPFGVLVNLEMLVCPVLSYIARDESILPEVIECESASDYPKGGTRRFVRAIYRNGKAEIPTDGQRSGILASMRGCNAIVEIPKGKEGIKAGETVTVRKLRTSVR